MQSLLTEVSRVVLLGKQPELQKWADTFADIARASNINGAPEDAVMSVLAVDIDAAVKALDPDDRVKVFADSECVEKSGADVKAGYEAGKGGYALFALLKSDWHPFIDTPLSELEDWSLELDKSFICVEISSLSCGSC